ncbi:MAG: hypothetical protein AB7K35_11700 [Pseudorhodoplanes sp.]
MAAIGCALMAGPVLVGPVMADPLHGRWSIDPRGCVREGGTAETAPLTVSDKSVSWFAARCTIRKTYKIGEALHLEARCWNEGRMKDIPVSLVPRGNKLAVTWDRMPAGEMTRCP